MKNIFILSFVTLLTACSVDRIKTHGWVSSGGMTVKDSVNAWWVKNTSTVRYCVAIDELSMSATREQMEASVRDAINYWKIEFTRKAPYVEKFSEYQPAYPLGVGIQSFVQQACDGQEDLRIQFGFGTLSAEQRDYILSQPPSIAMTVRTSYDEESLKGRGFVYVASDRGPNEFPAGTSLMEEPWKHEEAMTLVLMHEFGHVFGLPHGVGNWLMSEQFPELVISKGLEFLYGKQKEIRPIQPSFFMPPTQFVAMGLTDQGKKFFQLEESDTIFHGRWDHGEQAFLLDTSKGLTGSAKAPFGKIVNSKMRISVQASSLFYLPTTQKVFEKEGQLPYLAGPLVVGTQGSATFESSRGDDKKSIFLSLNAAAPIEMWGAIDGKIEPLISVWVAGVPMAAIH